MTVYDQISLGLSCVYGWCASTHISILNDLISSQFTYWSNSEVPPCWYEEENHQIRLGMWLEAAYTHMPVVLHFARYINRPCRPLISLIWTATANPKKGLAFNSMGQYKSPWLGLFLFPDWSTAGTSHAQVIPHISLSLPSIWASLYLDQAGYVVHGYSFRSPHK